MNHKIHKYYLVKLGKKKDYLIYACALDNCSHRLEKALIINKFSICWKCGEEFKMYKSKHDLTRPYCLPCRKPIVHDTEDLMEKLGIE